MTFVKSIRFKATLWYMLILTVTLLAFSLVLYGSFSKELYDDFDDLLSSRSEGVASSIATYWNMRKMLIARDEREDIKAFAQAAQDWVQEMRKDPQLMSVYVRILDREGKIITSSKAFPEIAPIEKEILEELLDGEEDFDTVSGKSTDGKRMRFRAYTRPVYIDGNVSYIVQTIGPTWLVSLALNNLILALFVILPLTVILAGGPGLVLVRLTLKPVDRMIDTLKEITAENLKLKIRIPDTKDEIKRLADTFNAMIERLERSFSSHQRFIRDVAHELKAPMLELKKDVEEALSVKEDEKDREELLRKTSERLGEFTKAIEDMLILSSSEDEKVAIEIRKVKVAAVLKSVVSGLKRPASQKDIAVSLSCPDDLVIDGDDGQIKRMVLNLLDNAIKYTNRKGEVGIKAWRDGEYARIAVTDTGIGMPKEELDYIFDRFYQAAKSRGSKNGFGIGLSIAKSIAASHNGTIEVESKPGTGSTFTVSLPISYRA
jgi:signal transduction histidine kinase